MKIQNCRFCGENPHEYDGVNGTKVHCSNDELPNRCVIYEAHFDIKVWNSIRIAPDDKDVARHAQKVSYFHLNPIPKDRVFFKKWMNPNYPKEASND